MRLIARSVLGAALAVVLAGSVLAQSRGVALVPVADRTGAQVLLYAESHALIIGVSRYTNGWPSLRGVREDIPAVKSSLEKHGFNVETIIDPTAVEIDARMKSFIAKYGQRPGNRLLFYYAGHGHSLENAYGGKMGYLVPRDAPNPNLDPVGFRTKAMSMEGIEVYAKTIQSKHALFIFDSCFAGSIFNADRAIPDIIQQKTAKPVRMFITAGTADQKVPDESIFRRQFEAALDGAADMDKDGYVTGVELGNFLETQVTNYSHGSQTPRFGKIRNQYLDKGDFVFRLAAATSTRTKAAKSNRVRLGITGALTPEDKFWNRIESSNNPAMFEAYLKRFPDGLYVAIALVKIEELKNKRVAANAPPPKPNVDLEPVEAEYVVIRHANVRAEPTVGAAKVKTLRTGTRVYVPGRTLDGRWLKVEQDGKAIGYVFAKLLQSKEEIEAAKQKAEEEQKLAEIRRQNELELARQRAEANRNRIEEEARKRAVAKRRELEEAERRKEKLAALQVPINPTNLPKRNFKVVGTWHFLNNWKEHESRLWKEVLPMASGGKITAKVRPLTELGMRGYELMRQLKVGVFDFAHGVTSYVASGAPAIEGVDLAGVAQDLPTHRRVMESYRVILDREFNQRFNSKILMLYSFPSQQLWCNLRNRSNSRVSLRDLKGKKIRTYSRTLGDFVEGLGARAVTIAFSEVVPALQRGVADCGITGTMPAYNAKWWQVATHNIRIRVGYASAFLAVNNRLWNGLSANTRNFMMSKFRQVEDEIWEGLQRDDQRGMDCNSSGPCPLGKPGGMVPVEVSASDRAHLRQILNDFVLKRWARRCGRTCADNWNNTIGKIVGLRAVE